MQIFRMSGTHFRHQIKSIQSFLPETFALYAKVKVYPCSRTAIMHITHSFTDNPSYMNPHCTYSTKFNMFRCRQIITCQVIVVSATTAPPNLCLHLHLKNGFPDHSHQSLSEASKPSTSLLSMPSTGNETICPDW